MSLDLNSYEKEQIILCSNSGCQSSGGVDIFIIFFQAVFGDEQLTKKYEVKKGGCHGFCEVGPTVIIGKEKYFYIKLTEEKAYEIIEKHLKNNEIIEQYMYYDSLEKKRILYYDDLPFFAGQKRLLLEKSPFVDPESFDDYLSSGGFEALKKALSYEDPFEVCKLIGESGLRGRGGGGFNTGKKWDMQARQISQPKYVICNGDEGDPGTFMDRSLLEGDPYRVIEGVMIAGFATMSNVGIIYTRKEYDLAVIRIKMAIEKLYEKGYLGPSVMGMPFTFDLSVEYAPGAYISGEETALISSIESKRGNPGVKPPHPVEKGLFGSPTLINNVETFSNIRDIVMLGNEEYLKIGTENSKGTKIFTLSGAVRNSGLVEIPFGKTFRELIYEIGGGMLKVSKLKAVQVGGASGSIIPASMIDNEISFEALEQNDMVLGAGGVVVLDENTCMIEIARYYIEFAQQESCGFCVPCREGTQKLLVILDRIIEGRGKVDDIEKIETIAAVMYQSSLCGLGREAINPVLAVLKYFKDELNEHIIDKKCRAGVCPNLVKYSIDKEQCIGCGACKLNCPVDAISGVQGQYYTIDGETCIRCGQCYKICPKDAILRS